MTLYCSPRGRTGKGRGPEGSGLYPELAAYGISEGCSPNVQAEVGRLVGLLPMEQARVELARRGLEMDEKAVRRIAGELGGQMLATRTRDLMRFRAGELPAGKEFAGKSVAAGIDGGRVRVRTIVKKIRVSGKEKRKKFRVEWREPKVVILFELDKKGRNVRLKGNGIYWTEDNAEAVFQLRAAVVSGRWEEILEHTRDAMARDRRTNWRWTPPECLAELKALDDEDEELTQTSTNKQAKRAAA
jgi:hypothetical protein